MVALKFYPRINFLDNRRSPGKHYNTENREIVRTRSNEVAKFSRLRDDCVFG